LKRLAVWLGAASLSLAACSSGADFALVVASSPEGIGSGPHRILVAVNDLTSGELVSDPSIEVTGILRNENGSPIDEMAGEFLWALPETAGVYAFDFHFPEPATYQLTLETEPWGTLGPVGLVALDDPSVVGIGDDAPRSETRTTATHDLAEITSDPDPDPSLYDSSIDELIDAGPAVVLFSSYVDCRAEVCGTLLGQLKALTPEFSGIGFAHVEVFETVTSPEAGAELVPAVSEWGLPSEPWLFVIDDLGEVQARFEGAASDGDLRSAFGLVEP